MKILALRGENLASLQHKFEIDFAHGRLGDAGLFAITGKTGAGKSTLLDAICLALFDRIPRLQSNKKNDAEIGRDDDASRIKANDVRSILSRGKAEGFAEVDFVANDGSHWRAHWHVRRARGRAEGRIQASEQWLENLETGQRFTGKKQELQAEIERLVGLTFEQFRRAVMLPQGEFAAFLKAGADERAALLERMTGGEIYGRLSVAAYERAREEKQRLEQLQAQLGDIEILDEAEQAELNQQLEQAREALSAKEEALATLSQHQQALDVKVQLDSQFSEAQLAQQAAQLAMEEAAPRHQQLEQIAKAQPARGDFTLLQQTQLQLNKLTSAMEKAKTSLNHDSQQLLNADGEVEKARQAHHQQQQRWEVLAPKLKQAVVLDEQVAASQRQLEALERDFQATQQENQQQHQALVEKQQQQQQLARRQQQLMLMLEQYSELAGVAEQYQPVLDNLDQYLSAHHTLTRLSREQQQIHFEQQSHDRNVAVLNQQQAEVNEQLGYINQQLTALDIDAVEQAVNDNQKLYAEKQVELDTLRQAMAGTKEWSGLLEQLDKLNAEHKELSEISQKIEQRLTEILPEMGELQTRYQEAEQQLQQSMAVVNLTEYRSQLAPDSPCPLCGSLEHPYVDQHPVVEGLLHSQQQRLRELQQQLQAGEGERRHLQQQLPQCQQRLTVIEHEQARFRDYSDQLVEQLLTVFKQLEVEQQLATTPSASQLNEQLRQWQQEAEQTYRDIRQLQQSIEQAQHQLQLGRQLQHQQQQLQQAQNEIKEHQHQLEKAATQWKERLQSIDTQQQTQQTILSSRAAALNEQHGGEQWRDMLHQQGAEQYIQQLKQQVEQYLANQKALQEVEQERISLAPQLAELETSLAASQKQLQEWQQKGEQLQKQLQQTWQQRVELIGEQETQLLEQQAQAMLSQAQQQLTAAEQAQRQAGEAVAAADAALKGLQQQEQETSAAHRKVVYDWVGWQEKLGLNEHELMQLLSKDEAWLATERSELKAIDDANTQAQSVVSERQRAVEQHSDLAGIARQWLISHHIGLPVAPGDESEVADVDTEVKSISEVRQQWQQDKTALDEQVFQLRQRLTAAEHALRQAGELTEKLASQQKQTELWLQMSELIGSATGNKFRTLAQGLTLQQLVILANEHLQDLAPRYALQPVPGSPLALQVIDHDMGDEVRSVESLSGGESFLVSLALALALASLAADTRQLGSLFIDEGFGTLDPDSLEMALACLDALQADGRQIGVISHVGTLVERIGVQVAVEAQGGGRSKIAIRG
ncbi:exonuclease SbcC [Photobacterium proteolyticum]|uniref:Exonuclease SbcC n=1 Tax=Photobacterium proteolyticum TaxID=1903952 RepID=A0A1Q9GMJ5_9GAMM|nr:AAA family ATPase [Photobacterium proteolyticum]OLQ75865.1 exonuclease SbcC [Photobacterium proteolyticum]